MQYLNLSQDGIERLKILVEICVLKTQIYFYFMCIQTKRNLNYEVFFEKLSDILVFSCKTFTFLVRKNKIVKYIVIIDD